MTSREDYEIQIPMSDEYKKVLARKRKYQEEYKKRLKAEDKYEAYKQYKRAKMQEYRLARKALEAVGIEWKPRRAKKHRKSQQNVPKNGRVSYKWCQSCEISLNGRFAGMHDGVHCEGCISKSTKI